MQLHEKYRLTGSVRANRTIGRVRLHVEALEDRATPTAASTDVFHPMVIAGNPKGAPGDSTDSRIDPNTTDSPYAGVGSVEIVAKGTSYIGTGTVIGKRYVLTAAHVVDLNNDGKVDRKDGIQGVYFVLNVGGDQTAKIAVTNFNLDPDFTGFNHPSVNDDVAVLTLAEDVPDGTPIYSLPTEDLDAGTVITMVGYGRSGDGVRGYTTNASPFVKRTGENTVDAFYGQDDKGRPKANEVFRFDFDGPSGNGPLGGPTLGNSVETQLGGGDSGGPAFKKTDDGELELVGVAAFTQGAAAPRFGSMGGGVNLFPYDSFITSVMNGTFGSSTTTTTYGTSSSGAGVGVGANPLRNPIKNFPPLPPPPVPPPPPPDNTPNSQPAPLPAPDPTPVPPTIPPIVDPEPQPPIIIVPPVEDPPPPPAPMPVPLLDPGFIDPLKGAIDTDGIRTSPVAWVKPN
jgi:Trypsin